MTSALRSFSAAQILNTINDGVEELRNFSNPELLKAARKTQSMLTSIDNPIILDAVHKLNPDMKVIRDGTAHDGLMVNGAAIVLAVQDGRPGALYDLVSSAFGVDLYPKLVELGRTGVLPTLSLDK